MGDARPMPGRFSGEQARQFRAEARQRATDAEQLRRLLGQQKIDAKELDEIIKGLRKLDDESIYANPETVGRLEQNTNQVFLSGTDDVPEQYRKLVEQYYRSLSKPGGGGKQ